MAAGTLFRLLAIHPETRLVTQTTISNDPLLQSVDQPGGAGGETGPDRDVGGAHGRDAGQHETGPDRDAGGAHGRDAGGPQPEPEPGPDRDTGGAHGRDGNS